MQYIKNLLATVIVGALTVFLFVVGLGFMLMMLVILLIAGLFVKPQTHSVWRKKWTQQWSNRQPFGRHKSKNDNAIEGQYTVVESH